MNDALLTAITTPLTPQGPCERLKNGKRFPAFVARTALHVSRALGRPFRGKGAVFVPRHRDAMEMLRRDLDFIIAPVNGPRIEAVNAGPFVLGMDRCPRHTLEYDALYASLDAVNMAELRAGVRRRTDEAVARTGGFLDAINGFARPLAAQTARALFGINPTDDALFMDVVRAIFAHTFLNIAGDKTVEARALAAAPYMKAWFADEIARRRANNETGTDMMGALISQGRLDDDGIRRTLGGMLVGSIDTTATCTANILLEAFADHDLRDRMIEGHRRNQDIYGLCLEALRRRPHNGLLLRVAAKDTALGGLKIRAGERVIAMTQAAHQDPEAFPEPERMIGDRPRDRYLHFGHDLHACAGRVVNAFQIPIYVGSLLSAGAEQAGPLLRAGPFPHNLPVILRNVD